MFLLSAYNFPPLQWTEYSCPTPNVYVEILILNVMILEGGASGRQLGQEGRVLK